MDQAKQDEIPLLERQVRDRELGIEAADELEVASPTWSPRGKTIRPNFYTTRLLVLQLVCCLIGITLTSTIWVINPHLTSIPLFLGFAFIIVSCTALRWCAVLACGITTPKTIWLAMGSGKKTRCLFATLTLFTIWFVYLSFLPIPHYEVPTLDRSSERYFIAINLYNNEAIMPGYTRELLLLIDHRKSRFPCLHFSND